MKLGPLLAFALLVGAASCRRSAPPPPAPPEASAPASAAARPDPLAPVYSKGLEGDMKAGLAALRSIPVDSLDPSQARQRACILKRFAGPEPASPAGGTPLLGAVIAAYHDYWRRVLLQELDPDSGEALLVANLARALAYDAGAARAPLGALLDDLGARLQAQGYHSIRGVTRPFHELMVWRTETPKTYEVTLPEGPEAVDVVLLRDFETLGWSAFATCERSYTGGWAEKDRLYCVADSYDLSSEQFKVSYLTHETQHFADYKRFPRLDQPELEYRAKLTELMASRETTRSLLDRFAEQAGTERTAPHAFANGRLSRDLARLLGQDGGRPSSWATVSDDAIRRAATQAYQANTDLLVQRGASDVVQVLGE